MFFSSYIANPPSSWIDDFFDWISPGSSCCREFVGNGSFCRSTGLHRFCCRLWLLKPWEIMFQKFLFPVSIAERRSNVEGMDPQLGIVCRHHHHHHHLFWKRPFLPRKARVRRLPIWSPSTYPWILPIQAANQALSCLPLHLTLATSTFLQADSHSYVLNFNFIRFEFFCSVVGNFCEPCSVTHKMDGRPVSADFDKYLPWFLEDNPGMTCPKGWVIIIIIMSHS